jgi:hypothetical protein
MPQTFLTSVIDRCEGPASHSGCFTSVERKLGDFQSPSRRCGLEQNHLPLPEIEPGPSSP